MPITVVLCGSTRFQDHILAVGRDQALAGNVVLGPWSFERDITPDVAELLAEAHQHMIRIADEVLVVAPGGYIGESTAGEMQYAQELDKPVRVLDVQVAR